MNIIAKTTLLSYIRKHKEVEQPLLTWFSIASDANWKNFNDVVRTYPSADPVGDDRVVFNIKGNKYRLVVRISFVYKSIQIKWFGTHSEYDKIDVTTIQPK